MLLMLTTMITYNSDKMPIPLSFLWSNDSTSPTRNDELYSDAASTTTSECLDDLDCSLNGICDMTQEAVCICDKPWSGNHCQFLQSQPVSFPQGYGMEPNLTSTWGGGILHEEDDDSYHLYVSRMTNDCRLEHWMTNSRIDHAVSHSGPTGPYQFRDIAIKTWSHNPVPLQLPDGTYAIVHIGAGTGGPDGGVNCSSALSSDEDYRWEGNTNTAATSRKLPRKTEEEGELGSNIHVSSSLYGPWTPLSNTNFGACNNPAPWVHPNGTIYIACVGGGVLKRASHIAGPYTQIATFPTTGGPEGNYEDPQIYTDHRGHFHCLYHVYTPNLPSFDCVNSTVSAHAYSRDGYDWQVADYAPYSTQLELETGETITLATRERPKPFFKNGVMTHLVQGVCGSPFCATPANHNGCVACKNKQWDFTLVSPLDVEDRQ
jgi:hypothetical protein